MCLWDQALIHDVRSGRLHVGGVLSRAFEGNMKINTLVHVRVTSIFCICICRSVCSTRYHTVIHNEHHSLVMMCVLPGWRKEGLDTADGLVPLRDCTFDLLRAEIIARSLPLHGCVDGHGVLRLRVFLNE